MTTETAPETTPEQQPADSRPPEPAAGKRERKPPSPEQARLAANKKKLKRAVEKMLASSDPDAVEAAALRLTGEGGGETTASQAEPAALEKSEPAAQVAATRAPTAEELQIFAGVAQAAVAMVAGPLAGTRYDPMVPRKGPAGVEVVPAQALAEALTPVLAKYLPSAIGTPEGQLAMVTLMWLAPPTLELVVAKVTGGAGGTESAEGAGTRAG